MGNGTFRSELNTKTSGQFICPVSADNLLEGRSKTYQCKLVYVDGTSREVLFSLLKQDSRIVGRTAALGIGEAITFCLDGMYVGAWKGMYTSLNPTDVGSLSIRLN